MVNSALWLTLMGEGYVNSKIMLWMDFEFGQFSQGLKHKTNREKKDF